jgi:predicted SAM-dependent methyltransferase
MKKLHLGCGKRYIPGFIHIDREHYDHLDYQRDITDLSIFDDNSIDVIYACHVLDHLSRNGEVDKALSEWYRVLKHGGLLRIAVSDFEKIVQMYNSGMDLENLWGHIVGGHKGPGDAHGCVFDFTVLKRYLEKHGFKNVKRYDWRKTIHKDYDDFSQAYIPHMDKEKGILMSLNVEAVK